MRECSKSIARRVSDARYATRYFVGEGVDIGGYPDPLSLYSEFFPLMRSCRIWDLEDGDAQFMQGIESNVFDFVFSSHCLEHLRDPFVGLKNWLRVLKPGGHLVITVPDEDMYEQGVWPSQNNKDHKHTFTIKKSKSWSQGSINITDLLSSLGDFADVKKIEVIDSTFRVSLPRYDQTLTPIGECAIEFVVRKRLDAEVEIGGQLPSDNQPEVSLKCYYNQYRRDQRAMKEVALSEGIFNNEADI